MMSKLKKGDPCPCCGQPIETDDPEILAVLTEIRDGKPMRLAYWDALKKKYFEDDNDA